MLDMGFSDSIEANVKFCPKQRQTLLFSATYPEEIEAISASYLQQPEHVRVEAQHTTSNIQQFVVELKSPEDKDEICHRLLASYQVESCIIFCATKRQTQTIAQDLKHRGWTALALNGDMEQRDRDQTLLRFANGSATILVATDVAARGLDIESVGLVINYDLPRDPEIYVHRIGRTGRAGREGVTVCLLEPRQQRAMKEIEEFLGHKATLLPEDELSNERDIEQAPKMITLAIDGGKKSKVRAGDILGSLTRDGGFQGSQIGKISITPFHSYIAIHRAIANQVLRYLRDGKIKGRVFKVRKLS
jgi:ATP-independent RNA helicase DbpA